ncbi:MAG: riboflavin synthase [Planctomycetota bacterium]
MFTGLIQATGLVQKIGPSPAGSRLLVDSRGWDHTPDRGASIAVSGCCLTVAEGPEPGRPLAFDVIPETLAKTSLGSLGPGSHVNLEHAATASTLLGGHIVQGHVDGVGTVANVTLPGENAHREWRLRVAPPAELMPYVTPKGSIAIEGVSLTIAEIDVPAGWFEVALIPETLEKTTLDALAEGDPVNLEADTVAKTVVHYLRHYADAARER